MLRICHSQFESRQQWTLCGQLAGPWVQELRTSWRNAQSPSNGTQVVVDLSDVTFIDETGETLLVEMRDAGVEFVATGIETKYLIENLAKGGERPLRRLVGRSINVPNPCGGEYREEIAKREKK